MKDSNENKSGVPEDEGKRKLEERKSDATSGETLSDIKDSAKDLGSTEKEPDAGPSPDGTLDHNDEAQDSGPM